MSNQSSQLNLGLLPNLGGSLRDSENSGQLSRLLTYYFQTYAASFQQTTYFSYQHEQLADYTDDPALLARITVKPKTVNTPYRLYAAKMPWHYQAEFQQCNVLRVFQTPGGLPALMARAKYGLPYVTTYGYPYHQFSRLAGKAVYSLVVKATLPLILRYAAGVIVTTAELQDYVSRFTDQSHIHPIPNGVDTTTFCPGPSKLPAQPPIILFVGRLTAQKNLARFMEALAQLPAEPKPRFVIIGTGELDAELRALAAQLKLDVEFRGTVPHAELPAHFQQADLFVLPSLVEGHPKVLIEAMSSGLPCLASNCAGNRIMIEGGKTGLLVDPLDVGAMTQAVERLLTHRTEADAFGQAARQHIQTHYNIHALLQQEVALLQSVARPKN